MIVSRISQISAMANSLAASTPGQNPPSRSALSADTVIISQEARNLWAATQQSNALQVQMDTSEGPITLDLDAYFTPPDTHKTYSNTLPPLLYPTQRNIEVLAEHITQKMPEFLSRNNISKAPASISYDLRGQIQLPDDYAEAQAFQAALDQDPVLDRQLRTVAALSSTWAALNKAIPFQQEYAAATSPAQIQAVIAKYSHLFSGQSLNNNIVLTFSPDKVLTPTENHEPLFRA